jgi:hypothetical protein
LIGDGWHDELEAARRGEAPKARACADEIELAWWFTLLGYAAAATVRPPRRSLREELEDRARRGRTMRGVLR